MGSLVTEFKVFRKGPAVPAPVKAMKPHIPTLFGRLAMERWITLSNSVPADLKALAQLRASTMAGCAW